MDSKQINDIIHDFDKMQNEYLNNPNIPQYLKDIAIKAKLQVDKEKKEQEEYLKNNPNKKIIGYNTETFEPIFGDK